MTTLHITLAIALAMCSAMGIPTQQPVHRANQSEPTPGKHYKLRSIQRDEKIVAKANIQSPITNNEEKSVTTNPCQYTKPLIANGKNLYKIQKSLEKYRYHIPPFWERYIAKGEKIKSTSEMLKQVMQQSDKPQTQ
ncbi:MAG: hypothetical protein HYR56_19135 [Acidobacteria bacterium]|nr:hypothetical protein [Acidobacteriota bacterium]MBI3426712.1 hypothetical protein [Acidobacteriota bacterium]